MFKQNKRFKMSIALVLILSMMITGFVYANEPTKEFKTLEDRLDYLETMIKYIQARYKDKVTEKELMEGAYNGMFQVLDEHSDYFKPDEFDNFTTSTSGKFGGIGIRVGMRNENITVIAPLDGTPGDRAGIKAGDIIRYVDGKDISDYSLQEAVTLMRGKAGTKITLGIIRGDNPNPIYFDITRENIEINPITYEIKKGNIGYIRIAQFNQNTNENVKKALDKFQKKDVKGIIIDVRNNPGGLLNEVIKVADYFIPKGTPIVHIKYKGDKKQTVKAKRESIDKPLVVLVNGGSASASEILAGSIQDTKSGIIVGTNTYGKGTVQDVVPITNGGGIKITIAEYLTSAETKIDGIGVKPDIVVKNVDAENRDDIEDFVPMIEDEKPKLKDKGLNVYGAQQRLKYIGYDVEISGVLDEKTFEAIKTFQKSQGVYPYGILDYTTKEKLNEKVLEIYNSGIEDVQLQEAIKQIKNN